MAGIAFELRKILKKRSLSAIVAAFGYSFALGSGPYVITITSLILINFALQGFFKDRLALTQFQVLVTHIIAFSLIFNGFTSLYLIRYLADMIFVKRYDRILPNMMGALLLNMGLGFILAFIFSLLFLAPHTSYGFALVFTLCFTIFMGIWVLNVILTGFKSYKYILFSYAISYTLFVVFSFLFAPLGMFGLMLSFTLANALLFSLLFSYLVKNYYSDRLFSIEFLKQEKYRPLILTGFFYNLGLWADKLVFWYSPVTSTPAIGPLNYSVVYDIPIFLAYLAISPGIALMFLKTEWEFAQYYERYYDAVRSGATLDRIYLYGDELIRASKGVVLSTLRVQVLFSILVVALEEFLFRLFKIPLVYIPLFNVILLGTTLLVPLISLLSLMFYYDRLKDTMIVTGLFAFLNLSLSILSIYLGPYFYGYGFTLSVGISLLAGIIILRRFLHDLHYFTFMHI